LPSFSRFESGKVPLAKTSQEHDFALILHPLKIPLSDPGYVDRLPEMS
jgi:hypothetical protein